MAMERPSGEAAGRVREGLRVGEVRPLLDALLDGALHGGAAYAIGRVQDVRRKFVLVSSGEVEETAAVFSCGFGVHAFDAEGRSSVATCDGADPKAAVKAGRASAAGLDAARRAGAWASREIFEVPPATALENPAVAFAFDHLPLAELVGRVREMNREIAAAAPGVNVRTIFNVEREEWRVARTDGTDVAFAIPRANVAHLMVLAGGGRAASMFSSHFGTSYEILLDPENLARSLGRAKSTAQLLLRVAEAPDFPGGSYPIVMDHSLSKVLAHEAFGHAAEADGFDSSILARNGRFRTGEVVAAPNVFLIDESIEGDHAYQPWSPNGVRRERSTIIQGGVLREGLSDVFTARAGGVRVTGAERAESYRHVPIPRMSNIRIELSDAEPVPGVERFEELSPETVRDLLVGAGILGTGPGRHPRVAYIHGFRGGQVNTVKGDFVFNCQAIFELTTGGVRLFRPAIFSGAVLDALKAIRRGFGPLQLTAMGTCGKWGQSVPSCGGSHWLLYLEPSPQVRIGGK